MPINKKEIKLKTKNIKPKKWKWVAEWVRWPKWEHVGWEKVWALKRCCFQLGINTPKFFFLILSFLLSLSIHRILSLSLLNPRKPIDPAVHRHRLWWSESKKGPKHHRELQNRLKHPLFSISIVIFPQISNEKPRSSFWNCGFKRLKPSPPPPFMTQTFCILEPSS